MGLNVRSVHALLAELTSVVEIGLVIVKRTEHVAGLSGGQDAFSGVNVCKINSYAHRRTGENVVVHGLLQLELVLVQRVFGGRHGVRPDVQEIAYERCIGHRVAVHDRVEATIMPLARVVAQRFLQVRSRSLEGGSHYCRSILHLIGADVVPPWAVGVGKQTRERILRDDGFVPGLEFFLRRTFGGSPFKLVVHRSPNGAVHPPVIQRRSHILHEVPSVPTAHEVFHFGTGRIGIRDECLSVLSVDRTVVVQLDGLGIRDRPIVFGLGKRF